jgi:hemolysin III
MADATVTAPVKPSLRGVSHQYAFFVALVAGVALVLLAPTRRATVAAAIYAVSLAAMFGTSALYHRVDWKPVARRWMRRADHSMIFLLVAGTYTPFALLLLDGTLATAILVIVWTGALGGIVLSMIWVNAPKWVSAFVYLALGWVGVASLPQLLDRSGPGVVALIGVGGALYTAGAVIYAVKRPNPSPRVFGYHEVFHALVIAAALAHFVAVAVYAVPS